MGGCQYGKPPSIFAYWAGHSVPLNPGHGESLRDTGAALAGHHRTQGHSARARPLDLTPQWG